MRNPSRATLKHRSYRHWFYYWKRALTPDQMCDLPIPRTVEAVIARDIRRAMRSFSRQVNLVMATTDELVAMR